MCTAALPPDRREPLPPLLATQVLSCGIAGTIGTIGANGSGVERETVRSTLLAWVLTLPVRVLTARLSLAPRYPSCGARSAPTSPGIS